MNSPIFIGVDFCKDLGKYKKHDLSYFVSGQYILDAQGSSKYVITSIHLTGKRKEVVIDI